MGQRVRAVTSELQGEKIDIVDYDEDPAAFIAAALSPARVQAVEIPDPDALIDQVNGTKPAPEAPNKGGSSEHDDLLNSLGM